MTRDDLRGKVQTVLGPIEPQRLGRTLMREHVLCDIRAPQSRADNNLGPEITLENVWQLNYGRGIKRAGRKYMLGLEDIATREVRMMKHDGGDAIVELTCGGLSPDPAGLKRIAEGTGVHLIMGCGHYVNDYQDPRNHDRTVEDFAGEMIGQIMRGAWGTDVRAGMIGEIGCSAPWTATEKRVMRAALIAAAETGAAINVHPGRDPDQPQEVADFIRAAGHPTERVVISHIDRTIFDEPRLLKLAESGVTIEFDLFGQEASYYGLSDIDMPNDATRLRLIRALIEHGHLDRVVISHDICYRTRLASFAATATATSSATSYNDDEARLQRGRDRRHPGAQPAATADVRLEAGVIPSEARDLSSASSRSKVPRFARDDTGIGGATFRQSGSDRYDPEVVVRSVPALFAQDQSKTGKRRNLGTFSSRAAAEKHERAVQYFKRH